MFLLMKTGQDERECIFPNGNQVRGNLDQHSVLNRSFPKVYLCDLVYGSAMV